MRAYGFYNYRLLRLCALCPDMWTRSSNGHRGTGQPGEGQCALTHDRNQSSGSEAVYHLGVTAWKTRK